MKSTASQSSVDLSSPAGATTSRLWICILVLAAAFYMVDHRYYAAQHFALERSADADRTDLDDQISSGGSRDRQLGFLVVGLLGCWLLALKAPYTLGIYQWLGVLMIAFLAICFVSVAWSDDPALTAKRQVIILMCFLAVLGVCKQLSARDLCVMVLAVAVIYLLLGVSVELRLGTFLPFSAGYRFAGTLHPNTQGLNCACICIAAWCLLRGKPRRRLTLLLLFGVGLAFLLLTKSRTCFGALTVALFAHWVISTTAWTRALAATWLPACAAAVLLVVVLLDDDPGAALSQLALLGRQENVASLSGRIPVWLDVLTYIEDRPLFGYGYGSFWNAERVYAFKVAHDWEIPHAHSSYLEMALNLGIVGMALLLLAVSFGAWRAAGHYARTRDFGYGFVFALLTMGLVHSFVDAGFVKPSFLALSCVSGLGMLAFRPAEQASREISDIQ